MPSRHVLYLVAVPIGNLEEITLLGLRILRDTECIFCEDTRVTRRLLELLGIWGNQELIKLNRFNEMECLDEVVERLGRGDCALVSDAGYPVIADPGYFLVMNLRRMGHRVQVVNGPCAFVHAIVGSGIDSRRIFFASFLTKKPLQRRRELEMLRGILREATVVFYESRNFVLRGLEIMEEVYGDIRIGVMRELSKMNESWHYDSISRIRETLVVKGEFVVIVPRMGEEEDRRDLGSLMEEVRARVGDGEKLRTVCRELAGGKYSSRELYREYVERYRE